MNRRRLEDILERINTVDVGVVGDGCLDIYWLADMRLSELSLETPYFPLPVVQEQMSLGAGSNVAMNLSRMGCRTVTMATVIGEDWRGREWSAKLREANISDQFVIKEASWATPAYCKPIRRGLSHEQYEDSRIDFVNHAPLPLRLSDQLSEYVRELGDQMDAIVVSDQFRSGVMTSAVIDAVNQQSQNEKRCFVDSRYRLRMYHKGIVKPNCLELMRAVYPNRDSYEAGIEKVMEAGRILHRQTQASVCATLGSQGLIWVEDDQISHYPAVPVTMPIDSVGAGDAFIAALAAAMAAGAGRDEAVYLATLVASVVVKKIGVTGAASPDEILAIHDQVANSMISATFTNANNAN
ncbi:MAG: PfkB family carbohydrate kinase [Thermaerobacter sp.]|nr:PfkB family carbohydrate kinase [Thermaerobacter sp.]